MQELTEKGQHKRDEILAAADTLFRKHGYKNMTLRMLAGEINIRPGHLNHYFRKKEDVWEALFNDFTGKIWRYSREIFVPSEEPLTVYAFAHCWFFLTALSLPDLKMLTLECSRLPEIQKGFVRIFASYFISSIKNSSYHFTSKYLLSAISAAQAAHFSLMHDDADELGAELILRNSQIHMRLLCMLLGLSDLVAEKVNDYVRNELSKFSVEDIVAPFKRDYRWYEIEFNTFKIERKL
jgi:AcrR family transcriptional regulator